MKYKKRLILFIDILGFRDFIKNTQQNYCDEISDFISLINSLHSDLNLNPDTDIRQQMKLLSLENTSISQFSDSIVISTDAIIPEQFEQLIMDVINIISTGYYYGFIFRGAITFGEIYHENNSMFGPGFIRAFDLEQKLAIYPRVVIDNNVFESSNVNFESSCLEGIIKIDSDGVKYIDPFMGIVRKYGDSDIREIIISKIEQILLRINTVDDFIKPKYVWLQNKLDDYKKII
jgi:hypothetical protein